MEEKRKAKINTTFRLSDEARTLLRRLSEHKAISQTAVLEILIRQEATVEHLR